MAARLGILVGPKGRGSNMRAIATACQTGELEAEVAIVIGANADASALINAAAMGLATAAISPKAYGEGYGEALLEALRQARCGWVCLAGYLRLLPSEVLRAFPHRILNVHPALLPKFGGKGMFGMHVHEAVVAARETESGCTVHIVTENYDEGPPILQLRCPVHPEDSPEDVAHRVLELEHKAYVAALQSVIKEDGPA